MVIINIELLVSITGNVKDTIPKVNQNTWDILLIINHFIDKSLVCFIVYVFQTCGR